MPDVLVPNGHRAVMLGREVRMNLDAAHYRSLQGLAKAYDWSSPTALAEKLLSDAIERAATNTMRKQVLAALIGTWQRSVPA
jgi:hypothetical protein